MDRAALLDVRDVDTAAGEIADVCLGRGAELVALARDDQGGCRAADVVTPGEGVELVTRGLTEVIGVDRARRLRRESQARRQLGEDRLELGVGRRQHRVQHGIDEHLRQGLRGSAVAEAQRGTRGEVAARAGSADRDGVGPSTELGGMLARPVEGGDDLERGDRVPRTHAVSAEGGRELLG